MTKVEMMDQYLESFGKNIGSKEICNVVNSIFKIDLDGAPLLSNEQEFEAPTSKENTSIARVAIDTHLNQCGKEISGTEIRKIINQLFGINLDAISSLEGARISLFSKGQWIVQHEKDLFVVETGLGDVDVKIYPTNYFTEQTGLIELPASLQQSLSNLGYYYDEQIGSFYFLNPNGEAVPDSFKGQTMGIVIKEIQQSFTNL